MSFTIKYNGISAEDIGALVIKRPNVPTPEPKISEIDIAGSDGTLTIFEGFYNNIQISAELNFLESVDEWHTKAHRIKEWLLKRTGERKLFLGDDSQAFYKVKKVTVGEITRTSKRIGVLTPVFTCEPYAYITAGQNEYAPKDVKLNPYMMSKPKYIITGTGKCTLAVNGKTITANVNGNLTIDTDLMIAYESSGIMKNTAISGNYEDVYLQEGENDISITSGFNLKVMPNWRVL